MLFVRRLTAYASDIVLLFLVLLPAGLLVRASLALPTPSTGVGVWLASALNFSGPAWLYFVFSDHSVSGATLGKRWLRVHVARHGGGRIGIDRAFGRTAIKLLPWEVAHFSAFALSDKLGEFGIGQLVGLSVSNGLVVIYLLVAIVTSGRRSVHDFAAGTEVSRALA